MDGNITSLIPILLAAAAFAATTGCVSPTADGTGTELKDFANLPAAAQPAVVARRLAEHFLETPADAYKPQGYKYRSYGGRLVEYPLISLWVNALAAARSMRDKDLERRLVAHFEPFLGEKKAKQSRMTHVDFSVFGALPLQIAMLNGDSRCAELGLRYADAQWTPPSEGTLREKHAFPLERQEDLWRRGYTPQTRLWIDDMYMITLLQSQAWKLTGERKYLDRAAKEMCLYLDELQLKDGAAAGLFYHAPDVPYVWGRGDGWMAAGMSLNLRYLPVTSPYRAKILAGYRLMMAALLKYQRADGLWGQLVNEPTSWGETSGSAMFAYAFIEGVRFGWLDAATYGPAARRAYLALVGKLDEYANLKDVCIGTGKKNDHQYYLDRPRESGDPHGQAALMWICAALLDAQATASSGSRAAPHGEPKAKISVFAHYVRNIAKERCVSLADAARLLQDLGVAGFDASYDDPKLAELMATGLRPASLYGFLKFRVPDGGRAQAAKLLETAAACGAARVMVIPDSFTPGGDEEVEFRAVVAGLSRLVSEAAKRGVTVTVEDFGGDPANPCNRMTYLKRFLDEIPDLKLALDSGNLYYAKRGEDVLELMHYAEGRIAHVHLKDQLTTDHRSRAVLGLGGVPNAEIVHHMAAAGYSGWYTLEHTVPEVDTYIETVRQVAVLEAWLKGL